MVSTLITRESIAKSTSATTRTCPRCAQGLDDHQIIGHLGEWDLKFTEIFTFSGTQVQLLCMCPTENVVCPSKVSNNRGKQVLHLRNDNLFERRHSSSCSCTLEHRVINCSNPAVIFALLLSYCENVSSTTLLQCFSSSGWLPLILPRYKA